MYILSHISQLGGHVALRVPMKIADLLIQNYLWFIDIDDVLGTLELLFTFFKTCSTSFLVSIYFHSLSDFFPEL